MQYFDIIYDNINNVAWSVITYNNWFINWLINWRPEEIVHAYPGRDPSQIYLTTDCVNYRLSIFILLISYLISTRTRPDAYNVI